MTDPGLLYMQIRDLLDRAFPDLQTSTTVSDTFGLVIAVLRRNPWVSVNFNIQDKITTAELSVDGLHNHIATETFKTDDWDAFVGYVGFVAGVWKRLQTGDQRLRLFYRVHKESNLGGGVKVVPGELLEVRYVPDAKPPHQVGTKHPNPMKIRRLVAKGSLGEVVARVEDADGEAITQ